MEDCSHYNSANVAGCVCVYTESDFYMCFGCDLRQWRRGACRSDNNTTSARLSVA